MGRVVVSVIFLADTVFGEIYMIAFHALLRSEWELTTYVFQVIPMCEIVNYRR